jgi:hypothetical protein
MGFATELVERLNKAPGPSRDLDEAIHIHVEGNTVVPYYTSRIDDALKLMPSARWFWRVDSHDPSAWVYLNIADAFKGEGRTPAISLCIAAVKAREGR